MFSFPGESLFGTAQDTIKREEWKRFIAPFVEAAIIQGLAGRSKTAVVIFLKAVVIFLKAVFIFKKTAKIKFHAAVLS